MAGRPVTRRDIRLVLKVARLYYEEGLTQLEISKVIRVSRSTISRMLQAARDEGIVQIRIRDPHADLTGLECAIKKQFNLTEVVLAPASGQGLAQVKDHVGEVAANWLLRSISEGDIVGVSWGTTLRTIPGHIHAEANLNCRYIALVGGIGQFDHEVHSNHIVLELAKALGGTPHFLHAPVIVESSEAREYIVAEKEIRKVLKLGGQANIALVGIGAPVSTSTMLKTGYFTVHDFALLREKGAAGEICSQFFDSEGKPLEFELHDRVIGLGLDRLRGIKTVVGVACGTDKTEAILAALRGGYLDVLITDEATAREVVQSTGKGVDVFDYTARTARLDVKPDAGNTSL